MHETLTTTHFFRDFDHWGMQIRDYLKAHIQTVVRNGDPRVIRVKALGAASGEEVYTLAAIIEDQIRRLNPEGSLSDWDVRIDAYDLSTANLAETDEGIYQSIPGLLDLEEEFRFRGYDMRRIMDESAEGVWRVKPEIRKWVSTHPIDLRDEAALKELETGDTHILFVRHVLQYFSKRPDEYNRLEGFIRQGAWNDPSRDCVFLADELSMYPIKRNGVRGRAELYELISILNRHWWLIEEKRVHRGPGKIDVLGFAGFHDKKALGFSFRDLEPASELDRSIAYAWDDFTVQEKKSYLAYQGPDKKGIIRDRIDRGYLDRMPQHDRDRMFELVRELGISIGSRAVKQPGTALVVQKRNDIIEPRLEPGMLVRNLLIANARQARQARRQYWRDKRAAVYNRFWNTYGFAFGTLRRAAIAFAAIGALLSPVHFTLAKMKQNEREAARQEEEEASLKRIEKLSDRKEDLLKSRAKLEKEKRSPSKEPRHKVEEYYPRIPREPAPSTVKTEPLQWASPVAEQLERRFQQRAVEISPPPSPTPGIPQTPISKSRPKQSAAYQPLSTVRVQRVVPTGRRGTSLQSFYPGQREVGRAPNPREYFSLQKQLSNIRKSPRYQLATQWQQSLMTYPIESQLRPGMRDPNPLGFSAPRESFVDHYKRHLLYAPITAGVYPQDPNAVARVVPEYRSITVGDVRWGMTRDTMGLTTAIVLFENQSGRGAPQYQSTPSVDLQNSNRALTEINELLDRTAELEKVARSLGAAPLATPVLDAEVRSAAMPRPEVRPNLPRTDVWPATTALDALEARFEFVQETALPPAPAAAPNRAAQPAWIALQARSIVPFQMPQITAELKARLEGASAEDKIGIVLKEAEKKLKTGNPAFFALLRALADPDHPIHADVDRLAAAKESNVALTDQAAQELVTQDARLRELQTEWVEARQKVYAEIEAYSQNPELASKPFSLNHMLPALEKASQDYRRIDEALQDAQTRVFNAVKRLRLLAVLDYLDTKLGVPPSEVRPIYRSDYEETPAEQLARLAAQRQEKELEARRAQQASAAHQVETHAMLESHDTRDGLFPGGPPRNFAYEAGPDSRARAIHADYGKLSPEARVALRPGHDAAGHALADGGKILAMGDAVTLDAKTGRRKALFHGDMDFPPEWLGEYVPMAMLNPNRRIEHDFIPAWVDQVRVGDPAQMKQLRSDWLDKSKRAALRKRGIVGVHAKRNLIWYFGADTSKFQVEAHLTLTPAKGEKGDFIINGQAFNRHDEIRFGGNFAQRRPYTEEVRPEDVRVFEGMLRDLREAVDRQGGVPATESSPASENAHRAALARRIGDTIHGLKTGLETARYNASIGTAVPSAQDLNTARQTLEQIRGWIVQLSAGAQQPALTRNFNVTLRTYFQAHPSSMQQSNRALEERLERQMLITGGVRMFYTQKDGTPAVSNLVNDAIKQSFEKWRDQRKRELMAQLGKAKNNDERNALRSEIEGLNRRHVLLDRQGKPVMERQYGLLEREELEKAEKAAQQAEIEWMNAEIDAIDAHIKEEQQKLNPTPAETAAPQEEKVAAKAPEVSKAEKSDKPAVKYVTDLPKKKTDDDEWFWPRLGVNTLRFVMPFILIWLIATERLPFMKRRKQPEGGASKTPTASGSRTGAVEAVHSQTILQHADQLARVMALDVSMIQFNKLPGERTHELVRIAHQLESVKRRVAHERWVPSYRMLTHTWKRLTAWTHRRYEFDIAAYTGEEIRELERIDRNLREKMKEFERKLLWLLSYMDVYLPLPEQSVQFVGNHIRRRILENMIGLESLLRNEYPELQNALHPLQAWIPGSLFGRLLGFPFQVEFADAYTAGNLIHLVDSELIRGIHDDREWWKSVKGIEDLDETVLKPLRGTKHEGEVHDYLDAIRTGLVAYRNHIHQNARRPFTHSVVARDRILAAEELLLDVLHLYESGGSSADDDLLSMRTIVHTQLPYLAAQLQLIAVEILEAPTPGMLQSTPFLDRVRKIETLIMGLIGEIADSGLLSVDQRDTLIGDLLTDLPVERRDGLLNASLRAVKAIAQSGDGSRAAQIRDFAAGLIEISDWDAYHDGQAVHIEFEAGEVSYGVSQDFSMIQIWYDAPESDGITVLEIEKETEAELYDWIAGLIAVKSAVLAFEKGKSTYKGATYDVQTGLFSYDFEIATMGRFHVSSRADQGEGYVLSAKFSPSHEVIVTIPSAAPEEYSNQFAVPFIEGYGTFFKFSAMIHAAEFRLSRMDPITRDAIIESNSLFETARTGLKKIDLSYFGDGFKSALELQISLVNDALEQNTKWLAEHAEGSRTMPVDEARLLLPDGIHLNVLPSHLDPDAGNVLKNLPILPLLTRAVQPGFDYPIEWGGQVVVASAQGANQIEFASLTDSVLVLANPQPGRAPLPIQPHPGDPLKRLETFLQRQFDERRDVSALEQNRQIPVALVFEARLFAGPGTELQRDFVEALRLLNARWKGAGVELRLSGLEAFGETSVLAHQDLQWTGQTGPRVQKTRVIQILSRAHLETLSDADFHALTAENRSVLSMESLAEATPESAPLIDLAGLAQDLVVSARDIEIGGRLTDLSLRKRFKSVQSLSEIALLLTGRATRRQVLQHTLIWPQKVDFASAIAGARLTVTELQRSK